MSKSWIGHAGTIGTFGGRTPTEKIERAMRQAGQESPPGGGEYAAHVAAARPPAPAPSADRTTVASDTTERPARERPPEAAATHAPALGTDSAAPPPREKKDTARKPAGSARNPTGEKKPPKTRNVQTYKKDDGTELEIDWTFRESSPEDFSVGNLLAEIQQLKEELWKAKSDLADLQRERDDPEIRNARLQLFRSLMQLAPLATQQAKAGKPALLRMIVRAVRLK